MLINNINLVIYHAFSRNPGLFILGNPIDWPRFLGRRRSGSRCRRSPISRGL